MALTRRLAALAAVAGLIAGCTEEVLPTPSALPSAEPSPTAGEARPAPDDLTFRAGRVDLGLEPVFENLDSPLLLAHAGDGSGRLYVVEQTGRILVGRAGGSLEPFLDVSSLVVSGGEQGLLGLAFHPGFERNRRFFVNYTNTGGDTIVAEYHAATPERADPGSARILLEIAQPFTNHNGGHIAFGPDGYLYIATGDGGSAGDPQDNAQNLSSLLGKLLRIDVDRESGDRPYGIPDDNPFVARSGALPQIWDYGLRNPWRFSFDRDTGQMWIGDVGQDVYEEIDHEPAGRGGVNYGWDVMEGFECYEPATGCDKDGLTLPVAVYPHDEGCSVTGGFVYRGEKFADMQGGYFFGDFCSGTIWALDAGRPRTGIVELASTDASISSFGEDEDGELYMTDLALGTVYRVTDR